MKIITVKQAKEIDRLAQKKYGISVLILMENAGRSVCEEVLKFATNNSELRVAVFCGKGNNGGDGFVAARHLITHRIFCDVFLASRRQEIRNEAKTNLDILFNLGKEVKEIINVNQLEKIDFKRYNLIIDALLGIGLAGPVRGIFKDIINKLNSVGLPIISVDIPSGLDADTGGILKACIKAHKTVTFVAPKQGMVKEAGCLCTGKIVVKNLGLPVL